MTVAQPRSITSARFGYDAREWELFDAARAIARRHAPGANRPLGPKQLSAVFQELAALGYLGSLLPADAGGAPLTPLQFAALVEGLAPELTLIGNHSVQRYLHEFGSDEQRARFMPGLLSGQDIGAIAITEPGAGSNLGGLATTARRIDDGYELNGRKTWVTHGMHASFAIVLARLDNGGGGAMPTRFIVPVETPGLIRRPLDPRGLRHLTFAEITLENCRISPDLRLGAEGEGTSGAKKAFPIARVLAALQSIGIARAALDVVGDFLRHRMVANGPLSASALVQDGYASLVGRCHAARLLALKSIEELDTENAIAGASAAKSLCCGLAVEVCRWASDTIGSAALERSHPIRRLANDAAMMAVVDGTPVLNNLVAGRRALRGELAWSATKAERGKEPREPRAAMEMKQ
ncbi:hypothetical protein CSC94_22460 [Zhengella mangrovi]|uniref:Acyl-CoA dehydrogenase n=1 Tax=Zhengella mangrovi TaxID=1982044 RepID=A0A2G1QI08_9HYPH|nr:acyl-CoA dehydrogenase family protein [Zhengella mangrovi]PHP64838.1 hypothetical protein CSC94_22460 [Zhengella mangrovi]